MSNARRTTNIRPINILDVPGAPVQSIPQPQKRPRKLPKSMSDWDIERRENMTLEEAECEDEMTP